MLRRPYHPTTAFKRKGRRRSQWRSWRLPIDCTRQTGKSCVDNLAYQAFAGHCPTAEPHLGPDTDPIAEEPGLKAHYGAMKSPNFYAALQLDRASEKRRDEGWVASQL